MNNFNSDNNRGKIGEKAAWFWLNGVPFFAPTRPMLDMIDADGIVKHRLPKEAMEMVPTKGYNKNKDFLLIDKQSGERMKLEIKTDFRALTDDLSGWWHTGNIYIEVDPTNVDNLDEILEHRFCKGIKEDETNWFNVSPGGHADWYAFYIPMIDYDGKGNPRPETDMTLPERGGFQVTDAQISQFIHDQQIADYSALITRYPLESFVCLRWEKLKEQLEKIVGIRFNNNPPSKRGKLGILLPLRKIVGAAHPWNIQTWNHDTIIVPCCQFVTNTEMPEDADARDYTFYLPEGIEIGKLTIQSISSASSHLSTTDERMQLIADLFNRGIGTATLIGQTDGITAYECRNDDGQRIEYQYFNSLHAVLEGGYYSRRFYHFRK